MTPSNPAAKVAPVKTSRTRTCNELGVCQSTGCHDCTSNNSALPDDAWLAQASNIPGQAGNVWFSEPEPDELLPLDFQDLFLLLVLAALGGLAFSALFKWLFS